MEKTGIVDPEYLQWIKDLSLRYRRGQIKAAVHVNQEMLRYYWDLGKDIVQRDAENKYGSGFFNVLSRDLKASLGLSKGFSPTTLKYAKYFYCLYSQTLENRQQVVDDFKQLFLDSDLYKRSQNTLTNFERTLPKENSDLASEIMKDPYNFAFTGILEPYNERKLKNSLIDNISQFLVELGTGFAYVGKEYRLQIGDNERFLDLLFYNLKLSCYVVIEVKIGKLDFGDIGQLGGYVVACNHLLRKSGRDNPTIGLLICKEKDNLIAQYALEASNQPIGISEYELAKLYPEKIEGTIPTIEEMKAKL
ncbi:MAG: DUF1016 family protein [Bacteroidales bacterium]|nr:DUF1016 family protein [Bacteroidales bacterium]